jgi:hypothetical protein
MRQPTCENKPTSSRVCGRKVDGGKIRQLLGIRLIYPDYQAGILASLIEP